MTEEEAKGTWCPEVRIIFVDGWFTSNRGDEGSNIEDINVCCWASKCQWWQWDSGITSKTQGHCGAVK